MNIVLEYYQEVRQSKADSDWNKVFILWWIPGSGKSFLAKKLQKLYWGIILSTDDLKMFLIKRNVSYTTQMLFEIRNQLLVLLLKQWKNIILDSNVGTLAHFEELIELIYKVNQQYHVYYHVINCSILKAYLRILYRSIINIYMHKKTFYNSLKQLLKYKSELLKESEIQNYLNKNYLLKISKLHKL